MASKMHWIDEIDIKLKENWEEQMSLWYRETLDKEKLEEKAEEVREFLLDPDLSNRIDTFLDREENLVRRRKAEILKREVIKSKVEYNKKLFQLRSEIEAKADEFLPFIKGKNVNISEMWKILMRNKNRNLRKEAHKSWKQLLGSIEKQARESIRLANKIAHEQGFANYPDLVFSFDNISSGYLSALCSRIKKDTEDVWDGFIGKCKKEIPDFQIHDLRFMFYKFFLPPDGYFTKEKMIDSLQAFLESYEIDFDSLSIKVETQDRACSGGCYNLKMGEDIRIAYHPVGGYMDYRVLFHEFGHAIHYHYLPKSFLLIDDPSFREGMADIWSGFIDTKEWLQRFTSLPEDMVKTFLNAHALDEALRFREFIKELFFELELYNNPEANFEKVWQSVSKEYFGIDDDSGIWSEFVFSAPLYMKDYIFAKLIKNVTFRFFRTKFGNIIGNKEVIEFLIEKYYKPGNLVPWRKKIEKATGERI